MASWTENFGVYGPSGNGKTRLVTSAMRADPDTWGDKALYVALDPGAARMRSILKADRPHLELYVIGEDGKPYDPYQELVRILDEDIATKKGCATIILDTLTTASQDILQAIANSGKFSDKHITIEAKGKGKLNVPMQGDYGAAQRSIMNILRMYEHSNKNLIATFHDALFEPDATSSAPAIGGPATVGKSSIAPVAGWFDNLIRVESKVVVVQGKKEVHYVAHTERKGPFLAKLRMSEEVNPISEFKLDSDPINFWKKVKEIS